MLELELQMVESQHVVLTEQSLQPLRVAFKPDMLGYYIQEPSKWHAYVVHALTQNLFIPLRAAQTPDYVQ